MAGEKACILIVDDEKAIRDLLLNELFYRGYQCTAVDSGDKALGKLASQAFDLALLDIRLPGMSGMTVLSEIWQNYRSIATIMITAVDDINTAVQAIKHGAADYIVKPFDLDRVSSSVAAALLTAREQTTTRSAAEIEAIAAGVEAQVDPLSSYSRTVIDRTVVMARQLGIDENEIQRWATTRSKPACLKTGIAKSQPGKFRLNE